MTRNERIVNAVRDGLTYRQAAEMFGVTRNVVAGACKRAGLKVGLRENARKIIGDACREKVQPHAVAWTRNNPTRASERGRRAIAARWRKAALRNAAA